MDIIGRRALYVVGRVEKKNGKYAFIAESGKRAFARSTEFFAHRGEPYAMQTFSDGRRLAFFWHMDTTAREIENQALERRAFPSLTTAYARRPPVRISRKGSRSAV